MKPPREKWRKSFSEWFHDVLFRAEIYDYRYPIKGTGVWMPYGFKIRRKLLEIVREKLDSRGHHEVLFPLLIPEDMLSREGEHIKSFEREVYWVTRGGGEELGVKLALRPTSETAIYPMFNLWIQSYTDLPVKIYQVVSVFRYETKATKPMIRVREVTTFKEAHTAHATAEEAEEQVREAVQIYKEFFDALKIPYVISVRPDWDKFPGAEYSVAFDTVMPDGRTLQIGTVHNLGQKFAKAFDIKYMDRNGEFSYVWQTCYGISERVVAALLSIHGDDHGLVLPSEIAPIQVVVVPIPYKGRDDEIFAESRRVYQELASAGFRVVIDERKEITPGSKFYDWELRGVPLRVEVGPRDVDKGTATLVRRDNLERATCGKEEVVEEVRQLLRRIDEALSERAWSWLREMTSKAYDVEEAKRIIKEQGGIVEIPWCGKAKCGMELSELVDADLLGTPWDEEVEVDGSCVVCGAKASTIARAARAY